MAFQAAREERVRILRRFKAAIERQRERFREYLRVLEAQHGNETLDEQLLFHLELETQIFREIETFERIAGPLEKLYRDKDPDGALQLPRLREQLDRTRHEVLSRAAANKAALRAQLTSIRAEASRSLQNRGTGLGDQTELIHSYAEPRY